MKIEGFRVLRFLFERDMKKLHRYTQNGESVGNEVSCVCFV